MTVLLFFNGIILLSSSSLYAQYNLVPNCSFEQYNFCPMDASLYTAYHSKPDYWYKPDLRGARYHNSCANGFANNHNGVPITWGAGGV